MSEQPCHRRRAAHDLADPRPTASDLAGVDRSPGAAKPDPILSVDNIVRHFGGITAVDVDHLEVQRGIITALIGPNGAGKTTFFNLITGFDRPDRRPARARTGPSTGDPRQDLRVAGGAGRAWCGPSSSPRR